MTELSPVMRAIKHEMEDRKYSVVALAHKAGVSHTNLYDILAGRRSPTLETLEKLCKALKLKVTAQ